MELSRYIYKEKSYKWNTDAFKHAKFDRISDNVGIVFNGGFYATMAVLIATGIVGQSFILTYITCTTASKLVKKALKKEV